MARWLLGRSWLVVLTCYTPTNIALLSLAAGLLGALGSQARLHHGTSGDTHILDEVNPYLSAVMRGFFVYLALISGLLVLLENPFSNPSAEQYLRLAGLVSLFSFMVNYDPMIFGRIIKRFSDVVDTKSGSTGRSGPGIQSK